MKKPTQVYYQTYSETAAKVIDDYTAEQCLYFIQKYCIKHASCLGCTFLNKYGKCEISHNDKQPFEWRLNK